MKAAGKAESGSRTLPDWAKGLIAFHVFASAVWALPTPPEAVGQGRVQPGGTMWLLYWNAKYLKPFNPLRAYVMTLGAWQYWDMFAPDPSNTDYYCDADVTFRDGTVRTVGYPRMADLPIPMKYVKERYRKFYERAHNANDPQLFPSFAQTIALGAYTDPKNPPVVVRLKLHKLTIAPPGGRQLERYEVVNYFTYAVDGRFLRQEAER